MPRFQFDLNQSFEASKVELFRTCASVSQECLGQMGNGFVIESGNGFVIESVMIIKYSVELLHGKRCFDVACPKCVYFENTRVEVPDTAIHTNSVIKYIRFDFKLQPF